MKTIQQNSTNRLEDISQNVDFGPKRSNLDQKGLKMGGAKFFRTVNLNFPKEDHTNSFYTKQDPV